MFPYFIDQNKAMEIVSDDECININADFNDNHTIDPEDQNYDPYVCLIHYKFQAYY